MDDAAYAMHYCWRECSDGLFESACALLDGAARRAAEYIAQDIRYARDYNPLTKEESEQAARYMLSAAGAVAFALAWQEVCTPIMLRAVTAEYGLHVACMTAAYMLQGETRIPVIRAALDCLVAMSDASPDV